MSTSFTDVPLRKIPNTRTEAADDEAFVPPEGLTLSFLKRIDAAGIRFCHWKSNIRLSDTLAGREDIDVLVDRRDSALFLAALNECNFVFAQSRFGADHPGVFHALGLDEALGEIVDVHAYYWVLSGDSLVKNYLFPLSDELLDGRRPFLDVPVPQPEAELALFVLRIALKSIAPVEILKSNIRYEKTVKELDWLRARADPDAAAALCTAWFPSVDKALFREAVDAVATERALFRRLSVGTRLAWRLRHLRRLGSLATLCSQAGRFATFALGRIQKRKELVPRSGGLIIALVGPKATGKSTLSRAVAKTLGKHLDVVRIHAGKPPPTLISVLPRLLVPVARRLLPHERLSEYEKPERRLEKQYSLFYVLRMTLLAYERRKLLRRALRLATSGTLVISDRYPSDQLGAIDSSCFDDEALARSGSGLKRRLMMWERQLYKEMPKPDLVLQLRAPLELAISRDLNRQKQGGPDAAAVQRRWQLESDVRFSGVPVVPIHTDLPLEETSLAAVKAVWNAL